MHDTVSVQNALNYPHLNVYFDVMWISSHSFKDDNTRWEMNTKSGNWQTNGQITTDLKSRWKLVCVIKVSSLGKINSWVTTHKVLAHSCMSTNFRQKWSWDASFLNMNETDS